MNRYFDFRQFWVLTVMHFKELIREPAVLFWGIVFPVLMSLGLGIAFSKTADSQRNIAIVDIVKGQLSRDSISAFPSIYNHFYTKSISEKNVQFSFSIKNKKLGNTVFNFNHLSWNAAIIKLKRGEINLIVSKEHETFRYYFDPANPDAQNSYMKLSQILNLKNIAELRSDENVSVLSLPGTRYVDFLIPGLTAMGIMMSIMWGLSYGIIEKRSNKLLRRMIATPMKKHYFILSLFAVRIAMNLVESLILVLFAMLVFHTKIQGSIIALFAVFIAGNIAFGGLAIFVSSRTSKTETGNGLINLVVMPMMMMSGIFFSYHNFPDIVVSILKYLPLTMLADSMRSIFIEGAGIMQVSSTIIILSISGFIFFIAGLKMFKWY
jgi:ABC-2 type transport system permease protein